MCSINQSLPIETGYIMKLSIHYYVMSLTEERSMLYEGFRDSLIAIANTGFPYESSIDELSQAKPAERAKLLRDFFRKTDQHFGRYYKQDPLMFVVVGEKKNLSIFEDVTNHDDQIVGRAVGDFSETTANDLGQIVWPIVKTAMAGAEKSALHDLEANIEKRKIAVGIEDVLQAAGSNAGAVLFVEEDYHVKGSIRKTENAFFISKHVDVSAVIENAVDAIIEKVLANDGNVVFLESGSLIKFQRIALIDPQEDSLKERNHYEMDRI